MNIIAWDAETCPQPLDSLTDVQRTRYEKDLEAHLERKPDADPDDASRFVRSLNPFLGWICCISVVRYDAAGEVGTPKSYTASTPDQERGLLVRFWEDVRRFQDFTTWVTFNGKRFDVEYVVTRSLACHVSVANKRLLDTYPYRQEGHVDLKCLWQNRRGVALADVCGLLGVESPKGEMDGSQVYPAVLAGRIDDVARYCEADARATLDCYLKIRGIAAAYLR